MSTLILTKIDVFRRCATRKQFEDIRVTGDPLFYSIAHDVAQHKSYRKGKGIRTDSDIAYIEVREAALKTAAVEAATAAAAAATAEPDTRDAQLTTQSAKLKHLQAVLQTMTRSEAELQQALAEAKEQISDVVAENHRLMALLYTHGYESPYEVPSSQPLISSYLAPGGSRRAGKRRRNA